MAIFKSYFDITRGYGGNFRASPPPSCHTRGIGHLAPARGGRSMAQLQPKWYGSADGWSSWSPNGILMIFKWDINLVGGIPTPLKHMNSSVGMMKSPIYGKIKKMFQTTNQ